MIKINLQPYTPNIEYRAETREYFNAEGVKIPRVSNIIKNNHKSRKNAQNEVILTDKQCEALRKAKVGTKTHLQIHNFFIKKEIPETINRAFANFIKWLKEKNYKIRGTEWIKGIIAGIEYGGTIDCVIEIEFWENDPLDENKPFLVGIEVCPCDFKTIQYDPKQAIDKNYLAQQGAYIELLGLNSSKGLVVYLGGNTYKEVWVSAKEADLYWQIKKKNFISCITNSPMVL